MICIDGIIEELRRLVDLFVADECECNTVKLRPDHGLTEMDKLVEAFLVWFDSLDPKPQLSAEPDIAPGGVPCLQPSVVPTRALLVTVAEQRLLYHAGQMRTRMVPIAEGRLVKKHVIDIVLRHKSTADTSESQIANARGCA